MKQIWAENLRDEMNVPLVFRLALDVRAGMTLRLASDVAFRLTVNGEMIGYGPRRKAHGRAAVNEYALGRWAGGRAEIEVECVSYRVNNFYIVNQPPFFAAEIAEEGRIVADSFAFEAFLDASRVRKVQRFSYQRGFIEAYRLNGSPERIPVRTDEKEVCLLEGSSAPYPAFHALGAAEFECGKVFRRSAFTEYDDSYLNRRGAMHFSREEQEYRITAENDAFGFEKTNEAGEFLDMEYRAYRLPRNAAGFLAFDAEVAEDAVIMVNYDEKISPDRYRYSERFRSDATKEDQLEVSRADSLRGGASNIDIYRLHSISAVNYRLAKGNYRLQVFEPDEMQYIRIYVAGGRAKISNVRLITYENDCVRARLKTGDPDLDAMYEAAVNTFIPNAVDVLTDCPSRERAGWLCDSYFSGRAEKFLTGANDVERNTLEAFLNCPPGAASIPLEVFPMCYPSDHSVEGRYIPNWCMWLILELESYRARGGDGELIAAFREKVLRFIEYMLKYRNADGLLEDLGGWVFVEWSRANDLTAGVNYPTNMLFSSALKAAADLYGKEEYRALAFRMDEEILRQSYNGLFFVDQAVRDETGVLCLGKEWTEACQYYAFWFGYADREKTPELFRIVFDEICGYGDVSDRWPELSRSDAFIGLYLRLDYLSRIGAHEKVVRDLKNYLLFQAKETGTYWEYKTPSGSCCHAFAALVAEWIARAVQHA